MNSSTNHPKDSNPPLWAWVYAYPVVIWQKRHEIWTWHVGRRWLIFKAGILFLFIGLIWPDFLLEQLKNPLLPVSDNGGEDGSQDH